MIHWFIFSTVIISANAFYDPNGPVVYTKNGPVRGIKSQSRSNKPYDSFLGIPYAKPPVGNLRFANPEHPEPWKDVYNATKYGPRCMQRNPFLSIETVYEGDEDCLYLNVYVPEIPKSEKLPVIFSIHWGGLTSGNGDGGYYNPKYFMDFEVILVIINYRVGILGFLSTLDDAAPGNFGLKDQVMALEWVQDNICHFGGDAKNVTIMGASAGAGSVHLHMVSPRSEGLFGRAISQSGAGIALWMSSTNQAQLTAAYTQAEFVNCSSWIGNHTELVNCFRNVPAMELLHSQENFVFFAMFPFTVWLPVTETLTAQNPKPFLLKQAKEYLEAGEFRRVPWLTGMTRAEGLAVALPIFIPDERRIALNNSFNTVVPALLALPDSSQFPAVSDFYLNGENNVDLNKVVNDAEWRNGFINMFSDRFFGQPLSESISIQLKHGHKSLYLYSFEYEGKDTHARLFSTQDSFNYRWGVTHLDDVLYQFEAPDLINPLSHPNDIAFSRIWISLWINFAVCGEPNPSHHKIIPNIDWNPLRMGPDGRLRNKDILFMNVTGNYTSGARFKLTRGFYGKRMSFWANLK
ncbi:unnamed protein product [Ceutorhynchus assimilis]|uniref:Carboxylic ester hydrolase n=1 Tax=Ceutorhynchus assimilis TaxID=467358 RepID=A0A9N9MV24_9CUCU|nr:unnamed protein product [Ceutorhynchus assimilis]